MKFAPDIDLNPETRKNFSGLGIPKSKRINYSSLLRYINIAAINGQTFQKNTAQFRAGMAQTLNWLVKQIEEDRFDLMVNKSGNGQNAYYLEQNAIELGEVVCLSAHYIEVLRHHDPTVQVPPFFNIEVAKNLLIDLAEQLPSTNQSFFASGGSSAVHRFVDVYGALRVSLSAARQAVSGLARTADIEKLFACLERVNHPALFAVAVLAAKDDKRLPKDVNPYAKGAIAGWCSAGGHLIVEMPKQHMTAGYAFGGWSDAVPIQSVRENIRTLLFSGNEGEIITAIARANAMDEALCELTAQPVLQQDRASWENFITEDLALLFSPEGNLGEKYKSRLSPRIQELLRPKENMGWGYPTVGDATWINDPDIRRRPNLWRYFVNTGVLVFHQRRGDPLPPSVFGEKEVSERPGIGWTPLHLRIKQTKPAQ